MSNCMNQLTIGKLAELTCTTADTLRYYEKMELLKASSRSRAGYRLYDQSAVSVRNQAKINHPRLQVEGLRNGCKPDDLWETPNREKC